MGAPPKIRNPPESQGQNINRFASPSSTPPHTHPPAFSHPSLLSSPTTAPQPLFSPPPAPAARPIFFLFSRLHASSATTHSSFSLFSNEYSRSIICQNDHRGTLLPDRCTHRSLTRSPALRLPTPAKSGSRASPHLSPLLFDGKYILHNTFLLILSIRLLAWHAWATKACLRPCCPPLGCCTGQGTSPVRREASLPVFAPAHDLAALDLTRKITEMLTSGPFGCFLA